jgi:uncharacterized SAM-binding protein YcdF (DUF218 family)
VGPRPFFRFLPFLLVVILLAGVVAVTRSWWLGEIGRALMYEEAPVKSDLAVVLAGDRLGNRIEKGGDLVRQGYVPAALVSGPPGLYGMHECDFEIAFAVRQGYPAAWFIPFPDEAHSTQEEARAILPELQRRHVHRVLLVTSEYHTGRAYRTFAGTARKMGVPIEIHPVGVPDPDFRADSWWRSREGQKITFMEWTKTVAHALGL